MFEWQWIVSGFAYLVGLFVGSFLNVVILRGYKGESLGGRSRCDSCGSVLGVKELIPIISFLIQKGRCRNCGVALSLQYPLVELGTGLLYAVLVWFFWPSLDFGLKSFLFLLTFFIGAGAAIVIFVSDLKYQIIPNGAFLTLFLIGIGASVLGLFQAKLGISSLAWNKFSYDWGAALILTLFLGALWFLSKGSWMGFGDVKLILALALILGFPASVVMFLFSFWLGGLGGVILLLLKRGSLKSTIPFGPFLLIGAVLAFIFYKDFLRLTGFTTLLYFY